MLAPVGFGGEGVSCFSFGAAIYCFAFKSLVVVLFFHSPVVCFLYGFELAGVCPLYVVHLVLFGCRIPGLRSRLSLESFASLFL